MVVVAMVVVVMIVIVRWVRGCESELLEGV